MQYLIVLAQRLCIVIMYFIAAAGLAVGMGRVAGAALTEIDSELNKTIGSL